MKFSDTIVQFTFGETGYTFEENWDSKLKNLIDASLSDYSWEPEENIDWEECFEASRLELLASDGDLAIYYDDSVRVTEFVLIKQAGDGCLMLEEFGNDLRNLDFSLDILASKLRANLVDAIEYELRKTDEKSSIVPLGLVGSAKQIAEKLTGYDDEDVIRNWEYYTDRSWMLRPFDDVALIELEKNELRKIRFQTFYYLSEFFNYVAGEDIPIAILPNSKGGSCIKNQTKVCSYEDKASNWVDKLPESFEGCTIGLTEVNQIHEVSLKKGQKLLMKDKEDNIYVVDPLERD